MGIITTDCPSCETYALHETSDSDLARRRFDGDLANDETLYKCEECSERHRLQKLNQ